MLKKWIREPSFWIFIVLSGLLLFLVLQASAIIAKLVFQAIGMAWKIPREYLKYSGLALLSLFAGYLLYRFWPETKEKTASPSTPEEKKKPDPPKNDAKDKKTSDGNGCLLPALIILLAVVLGGTFWKDEVALMIKNIKIERAYRNGEMTTWPKDVKTGKECAPVTTTVRIIRWDDKRIVIEADYEGMPSGKPAILDWEKGKDAVGVWYKTYPQISGNWWVNQQGSAKGEFAGWLNSSVFEEKRPLIIKKF